MSSSSAYERNSHTARLRQELSRSKAEQNEYLRNVDLAKTLQKRKEKKAAGGGGGGKEGLKQGEEEDVGKAKRTYAQRGREPEGERAGKRRKGEDRLGEVLDNLF